MLFHAHNIKQFIYFISIIDFHCVKYDGNAAKSITAGMMMIKFISKIFTYRVQLVIDQLRMDHSRNADRIHVSKIRHFDMIQFIDAA